MNRQVLNVIWPLVMLNVVAIGLWIASSRWTVVLTSPLRRGTPGSALPSLRPNLRPLLQRFEPALRRVAAIPASVRRGLSALREKRPAPRKPAAAAPVVSEQPQAPQRAEGLDAWIDEMEQQDTVEPAAAPTANADAANSGSEAWWRAFAASGGSLPGAAGSCRSEDAHDGPKAAVGG